MGEDTRNKTVQAAKGTLAADESVEELIGQETLIRLPEANTPEEELFASLIREIRRYHPSEDFSLIEKAYRLAADAHKEQVRRSGEPYIIHPLNVALILAQLELDKETIVAGILHDVIEDTPYTYDDVKRIFGEEIAELVEGVTKVTQIDWGNDREEEQAENLRKMFIAMAKDIRVILVKLADRLHNMRTYMYWTPETQKRKAEETLEIFSPVASRLGISKLKIELDDRSLAILHPEVVEDLTRRLATTEEERNAFIREKTAEITKRMADEHIECEISGRAKHLFSIYKKMVQQHKTLDQVYDIFAIRILTNSVIDCYASLGVVHEMYKPLPGRFKDYIAMPKPNMYQSLHTTVIGSDGTPFEIQIRTFEMHRIAEYGIAAHWKYKEKGSVAAGTDAEEQKLQWLRSIMDWQTQNSKEFINLVKEDFNLFSGYVYCFTPTGEVKALPSGSNTIDFAYAIHSAVGNRMVGAKVNGQLVPIETELQNGDRVEILTSQNSKGPSMDWLKIVRSSQARNKINAWYKQQNKDVNLARGKELIQGYLKAKGLSPEEVLKPQYIDACLQKYRYPDWDSVMAAIGRGGLKEGQIVNRLLEEAKKERETHLTDEELIRNIEDNQRPRKSDRNGKGIVVEGLHDLSVHFSHCCSPVPGDEIIGYVTRGRGISIHRTDCPNIMALPDSEKARMISAEWSADAEKESGNRYETQIVVYCENRRGMFADISRVMTENEIDINSVFSRVNKQGMGMINLSFEIASMSEIARISAKLKQIPGVIDVQRSSG